MAFNYWAATMTDLDKLRARRLPLVNGVPDRRWEGSWPRPGDRVRAKRIPLWGVVTNDLQPRWIKDLDGLAVDWDDGSSGRATIERWGTVLLPVEPAPTDRGEPGAVAVEFDDDFEDEPRGGKNAVPTIEDIAEAFHATYELLAPTFGYKRVFPYGYPAAFVPNLHHQYIVILRNEK